MCTQCTCMPPRTHAKTHMHACGWPMHKYEHGVTRVQTCVFLISCLAMHTHVLYNRMFAYECSVNFSCVIDKYDLYSYEYFLFVFEFLCTLIYTYIHTHVYWCMYSCMYLCAVQLLHILNQWMCTPFYLNTYIYMYTYVYIHTAHLHIHIHICIYIYGYVSYMSYKCTAVSVWPDKLFAMWLAFIAESHRIVFVAEGWKARPGLWLTVPGSLTMHPSCQRRCSAQLSLPGPQIRNSKP